MTNEWNNIDFKRLHIDYTSEWQLVHRTSWTADITTVGLAGKSQVERTDVTN